MPDSTVLAVIKKATIKPDTIVGDTIEKVLTVTEWTQITIGAMGTIMLPDSTGLA